MFQKHTITKINLKMIKNKSAKVGEDEVTATTAKKKINPKEIWEAVKTVFAVLCFIAFCASIVVGFAKACNSCDAGMANDNHTAAQSAVVTVQYAADGKASKCWVTQNGALVLNGPSAAVKIADWKAYAFFAKSLGADPATCDVWNWPGQDDKAIK
jgi:hypothetical protein